MKMNAPKDLRRIDFRGLIRAISRCPTTGSAVSAWSRKPFPRLQSVVGQNTLVYAKDEPTAVPLAQFSP